MRKLVEFELRPGDVLLCCGESELSMGIRALDGGSYSHAAIWDGESVLESTLPVVRRSALAACREHALNIDVYRYHPNTGELANVVSCAKRYLGRPYATFDLAWCTLVVAVSSWMPEDWSEMNALYGVGRLERLLRALRGVDELRMREAVTCVELVARAYLEANLPLTVKLPGGRRFDPLSFARAVRDIVQLARARRGEASNAPPVCHSAVELSQNPLESVNLEHELAWLEGEPGLLSPGRYADWTELRAIWCAEFEAQSSARAPELELDPAQIRAKELRAGLDWSAALLTPRLLEQSPSLVRLGRLHER